ncbi:FixH family protein [Geobacter sp.]|uniref:FixH family protein n=1 Tax=Geobacter sp. TaxID=46610 RepID=UPI0026361033|nr:FixH family protein [Geobacter sp.]
MKQTLLSILFSLAVLLPASGFALEQSFSQNGVRASVKLSPDQLVAGENVTLKLRLEKDGHPVTDDRVTLEVYEKDAAAPIMTKEVELLEDEYLETWKFEKPGDYRVVLAIADPQKSGQALRYEVMASVAQAGAAGEAGHEEHGFFAHHFGKGKWGWWGAGLMLLIMVPIMALGL